MPVVARLGRDEAEPGGQLARQQFRRVEQGWGGCAANQRREDVEVDLVDQPGPQQRAVEPAARLGQHARDAQPVRQFAKRGAQVHAGIAGGHVLLFEGDDYIGPAANHASRLCEVARPGEILGLGVTPYLPNWVRVAERRSVWVQGVGELPRVEQLVAADHVVGRPSFA